MGGLTKGQSRSIVQIQKIWHALREKCRPDLPLLEEGDTYNGSLRKIAKESTENGPVT
jgi:hypothetical protein